MSMFESLLRIDPASPRLTVYNESDGSRMEFSGLTLDNWASKVANMLLEEFDLTDPSEEPLILLDLPVSWQAAMVAIGTYNASLHPTFAATVAGDGGGNGEIAPRLVFTTAERASSWPRETDVVAVTTDPFGRGVVESGGTLPAGVIDFGPAVRFYGDQFYEETPDISQWADADVDAKTEPAPELAKGPASRPGQEADDPERALTTGWTNAEEFCARVLAPLGRGGSVVVVAGIASAERIAQIAETEKVTRIVA